MSSECRKIVLATVDPERLDELRVVALKIIEIGYHAIAKLVSSLEPRTLERTLSSICPPRDCCVIVPGGSPWSYDELKRITVLKGTYSPRALPVLLGLYGPAPLNPRLPAEKALGDRMSSVVEEILCNIRASLKEPIPVRPPPVLVASEVYVDRYRGVDEALDEATLRLDEGADMLVLASSRTGGFSSTLLLEVAREAAARGLAQLLAVDPADRSLLPRLAHHADVLMSLWGWEAAEKHPSWARGKYLVVIEPRGPGFLVRTCRAVSENGIIPILDPLLRPPGSGGWLEPLASLRTARKSGMNCPALVGINNVYEMIDADTNGSIAVLVLAAAEAGASIVLVSEESGKSMGATMEAKAAAAMANYSLATGSPPKDLGFSLLKAKCKEQGSSESPSAKKDALLKGARCAPPLTPGRILKPCKGRS